MPRAAAASSRTFLTRSKSTWPRSRHRSLAVRAIREPRIADRPAPVVAVFHAVKPGIRAWFQREPFVVRRSTFVGRGRVMLPWAQPVALVNARVLTGEGLAATLRFGSRILSVGDPPRRGDMVVDLGGAFVLPGLINAHDHLELNHYGLLKRRDRYDNATAWIDDLRPALRNDPSIRAGQTPSACGTPLHRRVEEPLVGRHDRRASQPAVSRDRPELPGPRPSPLRVGAFLHARTPSGRRTR